jgi:glycosyltransferase involved in cell wall biosynthesis
MRSRRRRLLAAAGDANDPALFGGIPYHFLHAAVADGVIDAGLSLKAPEGLLHRARWASWNATRALSGAGIRGYQLSESRLNVLWSDYRDRLAGAVLLNMFQLYPPWVIENVQIEKWFSIDQTLRQLFTYYLRKPLSERTIQEALQLEQIGYQSAAGIIVHSDWARDDVIEGYGIAPSKVHVVKPAANLEAGPYAEWEQRHAQHLTPNSEARPIRFVFVGVDGFRKGLDRLLGGLAIARARGSRAELRVIGCQRRNMPSRLRDLAGVEWFGFISKQQHLSHFLRAVSDCDVGCLLSRAEAAGIGLHEYHALGLAVLGTSAGGSAEQLIPEASVIADVEATDEEIASILMSFEANPQRLSSMKLAAWEQRHDHLWPNRVLQVEALLSATEARHG